MRLHRDPRFEFSLDFLAVEQYCRAMIEVLDRHGKGQRRFQVNATLPKLCSSSLFPRLFKNCATCCCLFTSERLRRQLKESAMECG